MAKKAASSSNRSKSKKRPPSKLLKSLPESVEHLEIVQQVAGILEEMQTRVIDVKEEARKELKKLLKLYEGNYKGLEKKVHQVTTEAKKQAQSSMMHLLQKWHEHKEKLPAPLTKEVEKIITQIGEKAMKPRSSTKKAAAPKESKAKSKIKAEAKTKRPRKSAAKKAET